MISLNSVRFSLPLLLAGALLLSAPRGHGAPPETSPTASPVLLDPEGMRVIEQLTDFYKGLAEFTVHSTFTLQSGSGGAVAQKREGTISIRKPGHLAVSIESGGKTIALRCAGPSFLVHQLPENTYIEAPAPPSLSSVIQEFAPGLSDLIEPDPKGKLLEGVQKLEVVGGDAIGGEACRQLRFTQESGVVDLWIEVGQKPLLRKMVFKVGGTEGTVIEMHFDEWNIAPKFDAKTFDLTPPAGARKTEPSQ